MTDRPNLTVEEIMFCERPVRLRMPFRFGVVTLTEAPQLFVRARIRLDDGREGWGMSADLLAPKWFDKSPDLSNEENFEQLRQAARLAADLYTSERRPATAFGHHAAQNGAHRSSCEEAGLPGLVASFGTATVDRAVLDALLRLLGKSVFTGARENVFGLTTELTPDLAGYDIDGFLGSLGRDEKISARHTVGLVDPITSADLAPDARVDDGLPETLEEVVEQYGVHHFKLKVGGDNAADAERLLAIAAVIDTLPWYRATLDGNEQYTSVEGVVELWNRLLSEPRLARLCKSILFIEQPISRAVAMDADISQLAALKPVEIDESDDGLEAFPRAVGLGYSGVSSKACKGFYRSLLNRARCAHLNAAADTPRYFMSAEDLTTQAGLAVQQDLALATLIGCSHVERNGHHYVRGMTGATEEERSAFLHAHPDLYREKHGSVLLRIERGRLAIGSLDQPGLGSAVLPDV
jgi:hypothetical protein